MNDKRHLDALKQRLKECEAQLPHSPPSHIYDPLHWFKLQEFKQKQNEVEMLNQQIANLERFLNQCHTQHPNDCSTQSRLTHSLVASLVAFLTFIGVSIVIAALLAADLFTQPSSFLKHIISVCL
jgi:hypothetical protein